MSNTDEFLILLTDFPGAKERGLTVVEMRKLVAASDVWMAMAGMIAHVITLAVNHTPKRRNRKARTGGPDVWQLPYLGIAHVFVTDDRGLLAAASEVSGLLEHPRCVVTPKDFFDGVMAPAESTFCRVCGAIRRVKVSLAATDNLIVDFICR